MSKQKIQALLWIAALAGLAGGGCGGVNASKSVSPLDFLLPGLIQNIPAPADDATMPVQVVVVAQPN